MDLQYILSVRFYGEPNELEKIEQLVNQYQRDYDLNFAFLWHYVQFMGENHSLDSIYTSKTVVSQWKYVIKQESCEIMAILTIFWRKLRKSYEKCRKIKEGAV